MSSKKFVNDYLNEAKFRLDTAKLALDKKRYNSVIRESQLIVEMSSKALLLKQNFVIPKTHKVTNDLKDCKELFSKNLQNEFDFIIKTLNRLRREYEISLYGDRDENISPQELYTKEKANEIYEDVIKFYNLCENELKEFLK